MTKVEKIKKACVDVATFTEIVGVTKEELANTNMSIGFSMGIKISAFWSAIKEVYNLQDKLTNLSEDELREVRDYLAEKKEITEEQSNIITVKIISLLSETITITKMLKQ